MFSTTEFLALSEIPGIGSKSLLKAHYVSQKLNIESILDVDWMDRSLLGGRFGKAMAKLYSERGLTLEDLISIAKGKLDNYKLNNVTVISIGSHQYPKSLTSHTNPPPVLYANGNISVFNLKSAAVIGTRKPSRRGVLIAEKTTSFLCKNNVSIVSGLALGIDTIAHQVAVKNGTPTIAVLVDIENIQPSSNRPLAADILESSGVICSENPPGTIISRGLFAARNRIQSGLSQATFVIEAGRNSGSLHAARDTINQGRNLYIPDMDKSGYENLARDELQGILQLKEEGATSYSQADYSTIIKNLTVTHDGLYQI